MNSKLWLHLILCLLFLSGFVLPESGKIALCLPGNYHGEDVANVEEGGWWAVCADTLLVAAELTRRATHDPMLDAPGEKTGVEIAAANCPEAGVLLRHLPGASQRRLVPASVEQDTSVCRIRDGRAEYTLQCDPVGSNGFRLIFSDGVHQQVLYETPHSDEGGWRVVWSGDLDNDGRLDLVLFATHKYSVGQYHLFLSTAAVGEQLLAPAASFRFTS